MNCLDRVGELPAPFEAQEDPLPLRTGLLRRRVTDGWSSAAHKHLVVDAVGRLLDLCILLPQVHPESLPQIDNRLLPTPWLHVADADECEWCRKIRLRRYATLY